MRGQNTTLSGSDFTFLEGLVFGGILSFSHNPTLKTRDVSTDTVVLARIQPPGI